jgi:hypothetical protein
VRSSQGAPKKKKIESDVYLADDRWPLNGEGRLTLFIFYYLFFNLFYGVFVRFSTRGVQKHHKKLFGENLCQNLLAEKVEKKNPFVFSHRLFLSRFWPFLCMRSSKTP